MNTFVGNKELYEYLKSNIFFNQAKQEDKIFELAYQGYTNMEIARKIHYTESTVRNRKKELNEKAKRILEFTIQYFFMD